MIFLTKRQRKNLRSCFKFSCLISAPLILALIVNSLPAINKFIKKADNIVLYTPEKNLQAGMNESLTMKHDDEEGLPFVNYDISEGFGYIYEEDAPDEVPKDAWLYKVVNKTPGEKPYPTAWTEGGQIFRNTYGKFKGETYFGLLNGGQVQNKTSISNETLYKESKILPDFKIELNSDAPQVLIYHTHTTESFEPYQRSWFDAEFNYRTTDETKNITMVGNEIQKQLEAQGIKTVQALTIHDYPSYNGSYERSRETVKKLLEQYPSIKVVLDIHRDAISSKNTAYQPFIEVNGKEAAQVMIISNCDDGSGSIPNYIKNFRFASLIQQQIEGDYPGLTRPILFDYRKYNQDLTTGSLLIEIGSHVSTLEQVQYTGQLLGASLSRTLIGMAK